MCEWWDWMSKPIKKHLSWYYPKFFRKYPVRLHKLLFCDWCLKKTFGNVLWIPHAASEATATIVRVSFLNAFSFSGLRWFSNVEMACVFGTDCTWCLRLFTYPHHFLSPAFSLIGSSFSNFIRWWLKLSTGDFFSYSLLKYCFPSCGC